MAFNKFDIIFISKLTLLIIQANRNIFHKFIYSGTLYEMIDFL